MDTPVVTLTKADRCDRCGAAAHVQVLMPAGDLLFCQHHAKEYGFVEEED